MCILMSNIVATSLSAEICKYYSSALCIWRKHHECMVVKHNAYYC